jgi:hypothetical protein
MLFLILPVILFAQKGYGPAYIGPGLSTVVATSTITPNLKITIPVVVHILVERGAEAVSMEQVKSQLDALNRDFNGRNEDLLMVPDYFKNLVANCGIRFELAKVDPAGKATSGVVYKQPNRAMFTIGDEMKLTSKGGDDAWPRDHYFNIWVCPMITSIHGFTSDIYGPAELDGIVLNQESFGTINKAAAFSMGRIAVHETGHWLGLKHIWGDSYCGDDGIDDTPQQKSYNKGCPSGILYSCGTGGTGDMYMNFMDLTNDACMYMFTEGQKKSMLALFEPGNLRNPLLHTAALGAPGEAIDINWGKSPQTEASIKKISVWPVPSTGSIKVDLAGFDGVVGKSIIVYNMTGQSLMTVPISNKQVTIDISSLNSGQYLLKVAHTTAAPAKFIKL